MHSCFKTRSLTETNIFLTKLDTPIDCACTIQSHKKTFNVNFDSKNLLTCTKNNNNSIIGEEFPLNGISTMCELWMHRNLDRNTREYKRVFSCVSIYDDLWELWERKIVESFSTSFFTHFHLQSDVPLYSPNCLGRFPASVFSLEILLVFCFCTVLDLLKLCYSFWKLFTWFQLLFELKGKTRKKKFPFHLETEDKR